MVSPTFRSNLLCLLGLAILLFILPRDAFAQTQGSSDIAQRFVDVVNMLFGNIGNLGVQMNERVTEPAAKMLLYITGILIAFNASLFLLKDGSVSEFFVQLFVLIVTYHLAKFLGTIEVLQAVQNFFNNLAAVVNPSLNFSTPADFLLGELQNIFRPLQVLNSSEAWVDSNFLTEPVVVLSFLAAFLLMAIASIFSGLVLVLNFVFSELMFLLALGLAPIFAYSLAIPFLSFLFDGWLKFLLASCGFKVVLVVVSSVTSVATDALATLSGAANENDLAYLGPSLLVIVVFTFLIGALHTLVPAMTSQLFGAGARLGLGSGLISVKNFSRGVVPSLPKPFSPPGVSPPPPGGSRGAIAPTIRKN